MASYETAPVRTLFRSFSEHLAEFQQYQLLLDLTSATAFVHGRAFTESNGGEDFKDDIWDVGKRNQGQVSECFACFTTVTDTFQRKGDDTWRGLQHSS